MDEATNKSMFDSLLGHFARFLVNFDLFFRFRNKILFQKEELFFSFDIIYENLSNFCDHCLITDLNVGKRRRIKKVQEHELKTKFKNKDHREIWQK